MSSQRLAIMKQIIDSQGYRGFSNWDVLLYGLKVHSVNVII
jgi:hypothetical protein